MSDNRCVLHKTKLEDFKNWLIDEGIGFRPGKGPYQVLQVLTDGRGWQVVFDKATEEHFTINQALMPTVRRYLSDRKSRR